MVALAACRLGSVVGPPGRGACAGQRLRGSLWQRRRGGSGLCAGTLAGPPQTPPAPLPLWNERGLLPPLAAPPAAAAASRLWARSGNMPLTAYCYLRVVGRGSYGEVTLVRHRRDGRQVGGAGARQGMGAGRGSSRAPSKGWAQIF